MAIAKISIIGSGNIAEGLGNFFKTAGIQLMEISSRNEATGKALAKKLNATYVEELSALSYHAGLYLLAVPDGAIASVAKKLPAKIRAKGKVVHSSGATSSKVLKKSCAHYGVFYPLQTFSKGRRLKAKGIPFCVTASSPLLTNHLYILGQKVSGNAQKISDAQRLRLHLAAVMVNNFTNHLFTLSQEYLQQQDLPFELLHSLISETVNKALKSDPERAQTGPAKRGDQKTMEAHIKLLKKDPELQQLYKYLSDSISNHYLHKS